AIGIASATRHPAAQEVPTFKELGMDLVFGSWFGFFVPASTPQSIQGRLFADLRSAIDDPIVAERIAKTGLPVFRGSQAQFQEFLTAEATRFKNLVQATGTKFVVE
ncbi:MAG: tripartite tricarboxylate transporter substrate-binding protein, partial [Pseudomonadota bacterium]